MRPVSARGHSHDRILCPHALGWKNDRAKVMSYQSGGTTSDGPLPADPAKRWRCTFVRDIEDAVITEGGWETWDNHSQDPKCIDDPEIEIPY